MAYPAGETNLVPGLAESYEVVDMGKGYIFKLKEGVTEKGYKYREK